MRGTLRRPDKVIWRKGQPWCGECEQLLHRSWYLHVCQRRRTR